MTHRIIIASLALFVCALTAHTLNAADPAPTPAAPTPEVQALRHACDLIQKQRDDLASQLLNANLQIELLQDKLQALEALAPKPEPAKAAADVKKEGKP